MAKVNGPLFSFSARGKIGDALVFTPWKGLNNVRRYVIPSNPQSTGQVAQRSKMTAAVAAIHSAISTAAILLADLDKSAYALWASQVKTATTWFNQATKNYIDVSVAGKKPTVFGGGVVTPGSSELEIHVFSEQIDATEITAGKFFYGTSPTAMLSSIAATITSGTFEADKTIPSLTAGVKYYMQFVVDAGENCEGAKSGIYHGVPTA